MAHESQGTVKDQFAYTACMQCRRTHTTALMTPTIDGRGSRNLVVAICCVHELWLMLVLVVMMRHILASLAKEAHHSGSAEKLACSAGLKPQHETSLLHVPTPAYPADFLFHSQYATVSGIYQMFISEFPAGFHRLLPRCIKTPN